jgi:RND family efflux transporter MFP subunit
MTWKTTLLICLALLLGSGAVTVLIFSTEPTAERTGASRETAMLVDVTTVERDTARPTIEAMGTVRPAQEVTLRPRVGGEIVRRADAFTPGGTVEKGDTLLQIDPSDYRNTLRQRRSELRQAEADLTLEMGRQDVAQRDYELLGDTLTGENKALVLRKPQLETARSAVEAARAAVDQAELNLRRTTITAPFDAHILRRDVNLGSQVDPGDDLGRLVGLDTYWVEATVPLSKVRWLTLPEGGTPGSLVRIHNRTAWPEGAVREGALFRMVGALADQTRMARVLIEVPDPRAQRPANAGRPPLMLGAYVESRIEGTPLPDVVRLNRDYLRENDTVWLMEDGTLRIQEVDVALRDAQYAYVESGLADGDRVVTTNLSTVRDGAPLRLEGSEEQPMPDPSP